MLVFILNSLYRVLVGQIEMVLVNVVQHCFMHHEFHLLQISLEAASSGNQVCDVAAIESIVQNICQHLLKKRKQSIFHLGKNVLIIHPS